MTTFTETIDLLADGEFAARCTTLLAEVTEAVEKTGGTGKLAITLTLEKQNRMIVVKATSKITRPEPAVDNTMFFADMFFADTGGSLVRDDPRQTRIPGTERGR